MFRMGSGRLARAQFQGGSASAACPRLSSVHNRSFRETNSVFAGPGFAFDVGRLERWRCVFLLRTHPLNPHPELRFARD
jgi:hypothetical protein